MKNKLYILCLFAALLFISCEDYLLGPETDNTPQNNFNLLWNEFDLYYPSFITKNINWDSLYNIHYPRINENTNDEDLWHIFRDLLRNLNDPHVYMYTYDNREFIPSCSSCYAHDNEFNLPLVKYKYLHGFYNTSRDGNFTYGKFPGDSVGYIYIKSFFGNNDWEKEIDSIIIKLSDVKTIIVDLRDNNGGYVNKVEYIAAAFVNKSVTYSREIARNGPGHGNFTEPVYHTINPRYSVTPFNKKITLLTNKKTCSGAEILSMVITKLDYTIQIGDSTAGGLGITPRRFQLLNGWTYSMPLSVFLTPDGVSLEGIGIVPDIWIRNSKIEIQYGYDMILEYALYSHSDKPAK